MPRIAKELSAVEVKRLTYGVTASATTKRKKGDLFTAYHAVGGVSGLLLQCSPPISGEQGARSWILRTMVGCKRRDIGLGGYPAVSLALAREKSQKIKEDIKQGVDPVMERKSLKSALIREQAKSISFEEIAKQYIEKKAKEYKTAKQVQKLQGHMERYAYPTIGAMIIGDIELSHIEKLLTPIWETKTETASRTRLHIERILDLAYVKGLRQGDNPARWKGNLDQIFTRKDKINKVQHYAALPIHEIPEFMEKLRTERAISARALEFGILTAARSIEIRGATWEEIDLNEHLWTVPAERMKAGKSHSVPLSPRVMEILNNQRDGNNSKYIFPNTHGNPLSDAIISKTPKRLGKNVTAHGFRSTFKDWARKFTDFHDEVSELALAHVGSDATRAAYARDELIDKRRLLMDEWGIYCEQARQVLEFGSGND